MTGDFDTKGGQLLLHHLYSIVLVLGFLSVCYVVGRLLIERFFREAFDVLDRPTERLLYSTVCGVGLLGTLLLVSCGVFGVHAWSLALPVVGLALVGLRRAWALPQGVKSTWKEFGAGVGVLGQVVLVATLAFVLVQSLAPPTDWDSLVYHLDVPRSFLREGRIHLPEDNLHVAFVGLLHMVYLPFLALGSSTAPAILNAAFSGLLALAVFSCSSRLFPGTVARLSPSLVWGTTSIFLVAATPRVDTTLTVFLLLAHIVLFVTLYERWSLAGVALSAVLFGFAIGIKYQALAYLAAVSPMIGWTILRRSPDGREVLRASVTCAILFALCAAPWAVKNVLLLNAPLYPIGAERQLQGWLQEIGDRATVPPEIDRRALTVYAQAREPFSIARFLLDPGRLTVEPERGFYHTNVLLIAVVLAPLFARDGRIVWLVLPSVLYVALVVVPVSWTNIRYLIPAIPPLTIASVAIIEKIASRFGPRLRSILLGGATAAALWHPLVVGGVMLLKFRAPEHAVGAISADEYLSTHEVGNTRHYWEMVRLVDAHATTSRTLMLFEARGFYFESPVLQDNTMNNWALLRHMGALANCLHEEDIGHVLVNTVAVDSFRSRGADFGPMRWHEFDDFAHRCLVPVEERPGFVLYRIRQPARESVSQTSDHPPREMLATAGYLYAEAVRDVVAAPLGKSR